jgi:hypothetical protein
MRQVLVAVPVVVIAALALPPVRRWLDIVLIRTTGTTVRTQRKA